MQNIHWLLGMKRSVKLSVPGYCFFSRYILYDIIHNSLINNPLIDQFGLATISLSINNIVDGEKVSETIIDYKEKWVALPSNSRVHV